MYIFPAQLPKFSNREDFLLTVGLYDDDTGDALDVSGVTLALPGVPFTSNVWTVTDGAIVTNSTTQITVPPFPIGNQLSSLALTVGKNLSILAGDPVTIADTATGLNQMTGYVLSYVAATGALVVQVGFVFLFEIRRWHTPGRAIGDDGYSAAAGQMGVLDQGNPIIQATLGNGILITDIGFIQILIPVALFGKLHEHTYLAGLNMADGVPSTRQIFVAELPVQYGGLSRSPAQNPNSAWSSIF
jgi:hypothetical protein